jgi:UDP-glucose 4-epimerase
MTRFMMTLEDSVDLVLYAFRNGGNGDIFVQKAPAATLAILAQALLEIMEKPGHPIREIGTRHGEKLFEALLSREEMAGVQDLGSYYRVPPDTRDLNYEKFFEKGEQRISISQEFTSHNTHRLNLVEMKELLLKVDFIQAVLRGDPSPQAV